jgi:hypothetical protein
VAAHPRQPCATVPDDAWPQLPQQRVYRFLPGFLSGFLSFYRGLPQQVPQLPVRHIY